MEFKTFKSLKRFVSVFYLAASCSKFGYVTFALLSGALKLFESVFHSVAITSSLVMYVTDLWTNLIRRNVCLGRDNCFQLSSCVDGGPTGKDLGLQ